MKKALFVICIAVLTQAGLPLETLAHPQVSLAQPQAPRTADIAQQLDSLVRAYVALGQFNGSVLVARQGKIWLERGYGYKNVADHTLLDSNSIFQIGSITKQFTSTVILKLVEQKEMNLEDRLSKYYPGYPRGDSITVENLLTHTSGIYNYTNDPSFMATRAVVPADEATMLALFKDRPLNFPPGTGWSYSNSGYMLLGYIIQKVAKMPYEQAVRKYIFQPLHMTGSGFDFTHLAGKDKATGYFSLTDNTGTPASIVDSSVSFAAGAMYATVGDLYRWHEGLQRYAIVSKASMEKAYTPFKNKYGYGWGIDSAFNRRIISHGGGIFGFTSNIARVTEDDVCIILLNNTGNRMLGEISNKILAILEAPGFAHR